MKDKYKKRWILVGIIWSFALATFIFNLVKIERYSKEKEKLVAQKRINEFIKKHKSVLKNAVQEKKRLYDHIPSPNIGLIKIEELLNKLAEENGLEVIQIGHEEAVEEVDSIDLSITCRGAIRDLIKTLYSICSGYPYLEINTIKLDLDRDKKGIFEIRLKYKFVISPQ